MGRSDRVRGRGIIYWACTPSIARKIYVDDIWMYVEVEINVVIAGDKVLSASAPV
jgi:hypothetical protein